MLRNTSGFWIVVALALSSSLITPSWSRANETATEFNIRPQSLDSALLVFAEQADVQVSVSTVVITGIRTQGVVGRFTPSVALARLLTETGLRFTTIGDRTYSVSQGGPGSAHDRKTVGRADDSTRTLAQGETAPSSRAPPGRSTAPSTQGPAVTTDETAASRDVMAEVVVTGTHIRGVAPVGSNLITIDRQEINKSGFATVQDTLQALPQNFGGGPGEDRSKAGPEAEKNVARGTSVNLRGLSAGGTLVLVDGRRLAPGGQEGAFTNVSSLPLTAVERIDVLADGASALYGSDAIGGVVNVILRKDYQGAESQARIGTVTEGGRNEYQFGQALGTSWESGRALLALEYTQQDALAAADRRQRGHSDLRPLGGDNFDIRSGNPGTIVIGTSTWAIPRGQDGTALQPTDLVEGTVNLHNRFEQEDYLPEQRMASAFGTAHQQLGDALAVFADLLYANRQVDTRMASSPLFLLVPSTNPYYVNPAGGTGDVGVQYTMLADLDTPRIEADVETYNTALGTTVELGNAWQMTGSASYASEVVEQRAFNTNINGTALIAALADPNPATAFNPFGDGSFTNPATLATLNATSLFATDSSLRGANVLADGPLFRLPGGSVRLAVGADYREQSFDSHNLAPASNVDLRGMFDRNVSAAFAEVFIPLVGAENRSAGLERLEISFAGRYEKYSDFGETTNPKVGVAWAPLAGLAFRGTWSTSFKAPILADLDETNNGTVIFPLPDPQSPTGFSDILLWFGKNADLQEETATSWSAGVDLSPPSLPVLKVGITYFDIEYEDRVEGLPGILSLADPRFADFIARNPTAEQREAACSRGTFLGNFSGTPGDCRTANTVLVDNRLQNVALTKTSGLDFLGSYVIESGIGTFDLNLNATYVLDFSRQLTQSSPVIDQLNLRNLPVDLRARGSVSWNRGSFGATVFVNYTDSYDDRVSIPARKIDSWTTADLQLAYRHDTGGDSFLSDTTFAFNAQNLFDEDAPFVNDPAGIGFDPDNANVRGRLVSLQVRKSW